MTPLLLLKLALVPATALGFAVAGLLLAWRFLPRPRTAATLPAVPAVELWLRLVAALSLATLAALASVAVFSRRMRAHA